MTLDGFSRNAIDWAGLAPVLRDESIGEATKWAFALLWDLAGRRPGTIIVSPRELGPVFGRSDSAARDWLERLVRHGLIEEISRESNGQRAIYVNAPGDVAPRVRHADPQQSLPGLQDEDANAPPAGAPEAPTSILTFPGNGGSSPAEGSASQPARVCTHVPQPARVAPGQPAARNADSSENAEKTRNLPRVTSGQPAAPLLVRPIGSNEDPKIFLQCTNDSLVSLVSLDDRSARAGAREAPGALAPGVAVDDPEAAWLAREVERARIAAGLGRAGGTQAAEAAAIADASLPNALAAAIDGLNRRSDPLALKEALKAEIRAALRDLKAHDSLVGRAAELVTIHSVPVEELRKVLASIDVTRAGGRLRSGPGALFNHKIRQLAEQFGVPWQSKRKGDVAG
jgi:hypothetical protein